jgi:predicted permease
MPPASPPAAFAAALGGIFHFVVLPILLVAGLGFLLQRRGGLDAATLTRLNFHFVVPAMVFHSLVASRLGGADIARVVVFAALLQLAQGLLTLGWARLRRVPREVRPAMLLTTMYNNAGNYALPLQELAFRGAGRSADAMGLQVFAMLVQNLSSFTVGVLLASSGRGPRPWAARLREVARFPPLYALAAAFAVRGARAALGGAAGAWAEALAPLWDAAGYAKNAFVGVAVLTLGAQLARAGRPRAGYPVVASVALRLVGGPALGLALVHLLGLHGLLAQVVLVGSATPTAVNSMLLCAQFDHHPEYAARAVFYSTLLSPLTVTLVVFLARTALVPP